jgi:hypothetical protein
MTETTGSKPYTGRPCPGVSAANPAGDRPGMARSIVGYLSAVSFCSEKSIRSLDSSPRVISAGAASRPAPS